MKKVPLNIVNIIFNELNQTIPNVLPCSDCTQEYNLNIYRLLNSHYKQETLSNNLSAFFTLSRKRASLHPRNHFISNKWVKEAETFYKEFITFSCNCVNLNYNDVNIKVFLFIN